MSSSTDETGQWFHPLIARVEPRVNRRRLLIFGASGVAAAAVARPQLSLVAAQTPEATPATAIEDQITGDDDAVALLRGAAETMTNLDTFAFEIETVRGESTIFEGLAVNMIAGAVRRPMDFTATVSVGLPFGSIDVTAVGIDGSAWVQNPLSDGEWIALEGTEDIVALVNPDTLILSSIGLIKNATIEGSERVDGTDTTRVAGEIDFADTADQLSDGEVTLPAEISSEPLPVLIWIDDEQRVVEIEVSGPILTSESDDVIRSIRFFDFNQPVEIDQPDV
jgi:hypothetical protein